MPAWRLAANLDRDYLGGPDATVTSATSPHRPQELRERGVRSVIPNKDGRRFFHPFDRKRYRGRNAIERMFCRLKNFRRIATTTSSPGTIWLPLASPLSSPTGCVQSRP